VKTQAKCEGANHDHSRKGEASTVSLTQPTSFSRFHHVHCQQAAFNTIATGESRTVWPHGRALVAIFPTLPCHGSFTDKILLIGYDRKWHFGVIEKRSFVWTHARPGYFHNFIPFTFDNSALTTYRHTSYSVVWIQRNREINTNKQALL